MSLDSRRIRFVAALLAGLTAAQVVATIHVAQSNRNLAARMTAVADAGYLPVPNRMTIDTLDALGSAVGGGLFFTATVGAMITLLTILAALAFQVPLHRDRRIAMVCLALVWLGAIVNQNIDGFNPWASAYFLVIPMVVFPPAHRAAEGVRPRLVPILCHLVVLAILAGLGTGYMTARTFSEIRNRFLLSTPAGLAVHDFYYRYTLYPAEAFKSTGQKLIRACRFAPGSDPAAVERMKPRLISRDYLVIDAPGAPVDLPLSVTEGAVILGDTLDLAVGASVREFLRSPDQYLDAHSEATDRNAALREFTFISLVTVTGLVAYLVVYAPARLVAGFFLSANRAAVVGAVVCLAVGLAVLAAAEYRSPGPPLEPAAAVQALHSPELDLRVAALRTVAQQRIEIDGRFDWAKLLTSPHVVERYWLVHAFMASRSEATLAGLYTLARDDHIGVAYQACAGLRLRKDRKAIPVLRGVVTTSPHWYVQGYAYRAMKALGWRQTGST